MLPRSMQNTRRELADAKAENDALRDDVAAGRRRLHISASLSVSEATTPPGVDNAASPDLAITAERDYFTLRERLRLLCKTTGRKLRSILMSRDRAFAPYRWATHVIIVEST